MIMNTFEAFKLKTNPFWMTPAVNSDELIWAGFPEIKRKFEDRIKRSISIPNTSLILNWGEYGSGKTHASRYFNKESVLQELSGKAGRAMPYSCVIDFPRSKEPVNDIYTQIIDKLDIKKIREDFRESGLNIGEVAQEVTDNIFIRNVLKLVFDGTVGLDLMKQFLYGNVSATEFKSFVKAGVQRKFTSDSDLAEFLGAFFSILTYDKKVCSCVIIWFDEFEDISVLNTVGLANVNSFLRFLIDKIPNNLLLFLNLTRSAMMDTTDLAEYLQESVKSRIKDRIELSMPTPDDLKLYLKDLLNHPIYRIGNTGSDIYFPFEEGVIEKLISDLGDVSLRRFNEAFSLLLESAAFDNRDHITLEYYNQIRNEIIGWKE